MFIPYLFHVIHLTGRPGTDRYCIVCYLFRLASIAHTNLKVHRTEEPHSISIRPLLSVTNPVHLRWHRPRPTITWGVQCGNHSRKDRSSQSLPSAAENINTECFNVSIKGKWSILMVSPLFYFESRIMILRLRTSMHRFELPFRIDTSREFRLFIRSWILSNP